MNITTKAIADEATKKYLSKIQSTTRHKENIRIYLRPIVESITNKILVVSCDNNNNEDDDNSTVVRASSSNTSHMDGREDKNVVVVSLKNNGYNDNNDNNAIFNHQYGKKRSISLGSEEDDNNCNSNDDNDNNNEDKSEERTIARMEAFLKHCILAVPKEAIRSNNSINNSTRSIHEEAADNDSNNHNSLFSLSTALLGLKDDNNETKTALPPLPATRILRSLSSNTKIIEYPQFDYKDLFIRLDIYIKCLKRISATQEECVIHIENNKLLQARTNCIIRSLLSNMDSGLMTASVQPILLQLLSVVTMEVLAIHILDEEITNIMEKLCRDYEHQISFASLTFLSSPEQSIKFLSPLILSYLQYLQIHHDRFEYNSSIECMLRSTLPSKTRMLFKQTEFLSINHVLSTCQEQSNILSNLILPSDVSRLNSKSLRDNTNTCAKDDKDLQQALRDLKREIIMVNGFILPTVTTYKELVQILGDLLNSRNSNVSNRRTSTTSGNDADLENDNDNNSNNKNRNNNTALEYKTINKITKRLLLSASRTRASDGYFIIKDLFGCDDVVIVPHHYQHNKKTKINSSSPNTTNGNGNKKKVSNKKKYCTIEIQVRLSSLIIKCYATYDVIPNYVTTTPSYVNQTNNSNTNASLVEPLITLETITSETISLQAVRICDANSSDDDVSGINNNSDGSSNGRFGVILREKKTNVTGKRILSIKPAKYTKVAVWNTPS